MSDDSRRPDITASIVFADYASADPLGKINMIGAGIRILQRPPGSPVTQSCAVAVLLTSSMPTEGDAPAVEIVLTTATGDVYQYTPPVGPSQAIRVAQNIDFPPVVVPGLVIPRHALPSVASFAINFNNGLPLEPGFAYQWRLQVDHDVKATYSFYVAAPQPLPTVG